MNRNYLKNIHPDDLSLWLSVETATWRLAEAAKVHRKLRLVRPMPLRLLDTVQGYYLKHPVNEIWLSLRRHEGGPRYALHQLIDTIAHEVAHLKGGWPTAGHGPEFFHAHAEMLTLQEKIGMRLDLLASGVIFEP